MTDSSSLPRFEDRRSRPLLFRNAFASNATHPDPPQKDDEDMFLPFLLSSFLCEGEELSPRGMATAVD